MTYRSERPGGLNDYHVRETKPVKQQPDIGAPRCYISFEGDENDRYQE